MKNNRIGLMANDSPALFIGLLGILKSGGTFVPLNPVFPNERIGFIIADCGIKVLLTDKANYPQGQQIAEANPCIEHLLCIEHILEKGKTGQAPAQNTKNSTCYVIYTSGSTGRPKGVPITHGNLLPLFTWFRNYFSLAEHTRVLQNLSYTFDFGVFEILTTLLYGGRLYVINKKIVGDFSKYVDYINKHKIDTLHTTPVFFRNIAAEGHSMPSLRILHLGGERLTGKLVKSASLVVPADCNIYNGYGPTEATINCAIFPIKAGAAEEVEGLESIPIGRPSAFNELYIMDKNGSLQPVGAAGELCVTGPGLSRGYLNRPELTNKSFCGVQGRFFQKEPLVIYRTGDLTRWLPDGNIEFLGRIDQQVKIRGFRIECGEIETCLSKHPQIKETIVTAREHASGSFYLCAYVTPIQRGGKIPKVGELREHLLKELPDYMVPAYFIPLEQIPVTSTGKIDRKFLPEPDETLIETGIRYAAPATDTDKKLAAIWQEILGLTKIGINDDFFELGGDSIMVNRCIARIREEMQVEIPLRTFFQQPYIKALSGEIEKQERRVSSISIKPAVRGDEIPLSFAQERLWFLQELDEENIAYFVPRVIRITGKLEKQLLERTFTEIIRRHEILRTVFPVTEGRPMQRVREPVPFKIPVIRSNLESFLAEEVRKPFDFEKGPLLRVTLLKLTPVEHLLVLTEHHLIHDGWTQGVLLNEFIEIFTAYSMGREHSLPELPIQYADFAIWQRDYLQGDVLDRHLEYWKEQLRGLEPVLELPTDRPRPAAVSGEGALNIFRLTAEFSRQLKEFSRRNGATLFMTMLAVFKTFLYRYTGVEDLCVGTGVANRRYREMEGMLGMVINTLALRTRLSGDMSFRQCLQEVKQTCLGAYKHEDTPFGKVVEAMQPERSLSFSPLFQVLFSFMDTPTRELTLPGLELHLEDTHNRSSKFDINIVIVPAGESSEETLVEWEYNTDIFDASTVERMVAHYTRLLEEVVHTPGETLAKLPLLSEQETRQLLYTFNDTTAQYPLDRMIHQLFEEQVEKTPDKIAVQHRTYRTYKKLDEESNQLAALLIAKGLRPGHITGILGGRSVEMLAGILAILKAGGAYLPIDADYPEERIQYMLTDSSVGVLVSEVSGVSGEITVIDLKDIAKESKISPAYPTHLTHLTHLTHPAYVMYTSGSTGQPKGVVVTHRNVVRLVKNSNYVPLNRETRILQTGAPVFDATTFEIWGSLLNGGELVLVNEEIILDAHRLEDALKDHHINTLWLSAPLFNRLMQQNIRLFAPLQYLLVGGDTLTPGHINAVKDEYPDLKIINGYGPTENTTFSTTYLIEEKFEQNIPIGRPISNSTAYIVDKSNNFLPIGVWGELLVGGDGVSLGYLNNPELTAERFNRSYRSYRSYTFYKTGDLARWLPDGVIEFNGRMDRQVKIRGFRIELGEIEKRLCDHKQVKEAVVIDRSDRGEKYLCAYVVPFSEAAPAARELKDHLSRCLPGHMIPSYFIPLDQIPLTPNGKIDRKSLPQPSVDDTGTNASGRHIAPRDGVEKKLVQIWEEVLNIKGIDIDDNFFDLGGHSLNAAFLVSEIHKALNVKIPLKELFIKGSIRGLSEYLKEAEQEKCAPIEAVEKKEYYPLSPAQKRLYLLHRMEEASTVYNIPAILELDGQPDINRLEEVFGELIQRHESLRTSFHMPGNEPVQKIIEKAVFEIEYYPAVPDPLPVISDFVQPFNLAQAPLLRLGLIKQPCILMVDMHHIITDGTSMGVFVREFSALYPGAALPPLGLRYRDYVQWQHWQQESEAIRSQAAYWQDRFRDEIPVLELPVDFARPAVTAFEGARTGFELTAEQTRCLKELAAAEGLTLYTLLLAVFYVFLAKVSGAETIIIGTVTAGRRHADLTNIIGMFVNTLALKNHPQNQKTFKEFLKAVNEKTLEDFENQDFPFEELVERLPVDRDTGRNPLFDVMFILQNVDIPEIEIPGLKLKPFPYENNTSKFDLMLQAIEKEEKLFFTFEYGAALFRQDTIDRFKGYFKRSVGAVTDSPLVKLSEIEIISGEEKQRILFDFNDTASDYPKDKTIHRLFEEQAARTPHFAALIGPIGPIILSYKELDKKSGQLAHSLRKKGVRPDSIAAIMVERSLEMIIGIIAILKAGGAYLPIDLKYPEERKQYMLADSGTGILVSEVSGEITVIDLKDTAKESKISPAYPTHPAYVMYTSGSTGQPKGVVVTHRNAVRLVKNTNYVPLSGETRVLQTGAPVFDATTFEIWGSLLNGGELVLVNEEIILDAHRLEDVLKDHHINTLWLSAPLFNRLMQQNIRLFAPLQYLLVGGDTLTPGHINAVKDEYPDLKIINGYGPTENTTFSTTYLIEEKFEQDIPIGRPINNSTAYIVDKNNNFLPIGIWGELLVGGDGVSLGYLNNPELTAARFNRSYRSYTIYKTGDLARWQPGGVIEFKGRMDRQVKIRGFRIELGEIEKRLCDHKQVKEAVVIDRSDRGEKYLCAYVVPLSDAAPAARELKDHLSRCLPGYMIPSYFIPLAQIPLTPNGKIDRKSLPGPAVGDTGTGAPRDSMEKKLVQIWEEVLNIKGIGIDDNFFDLGGHSLNAAFLVSKIHKALNVKIPLKELFVKGSIRELAEYLKGAEQGKWSLIEAVEKKEYYPLSPAQKRLYLLHQMDESSTVYNIPAIMELEGDLDIERLEEVFGQLMERHGSLRTSFHMLGDEPVQKIIEKAAFEIDYYLAAPDPLPLISGFVQPFNLSQAPLLRVGLIKQPGILMVDMHHIITDGTSMGIFVKELTALYSGAAIPLLTLRYRDYAQWQHWQQESGAIQAQADYWMHRFRDEIPVLELPIDFARPTVTAFEGARTAFELSTEQTRRLKELAAAEGLTLYTLLLAVFYVFLAKISSAETIIVGTVTAGRQHADLAGIIGMFVNSLALKNYPQNQKTFKEFLKEVNEKTLEDFENQDFPFEELVERLPINRDTGRNPLFDVLFTMQNVDIPEIEIPGLKLKPFPYKSTTSKFDLMLQAEEKEEELLFTFEYSTALFKQDTIDRFKGYFKRSACTVLDCPSVKVLEIEIISEEEKQRILFDFNDTAADYPKDKTIHQLFEEQAKKRADKIAIQHRSNRNYRTYTTYKKLNRESNKRAALLMQKGVRPGNIVGILGKRSLEMVTGILAILKVGGAYLPIDADYPEERIQYMLTDSGTKILLTDLPEKHRFNCQLSIVNCQLLMGPAPNPPTHPTHPAYVMYTSGSTGQPKGVVVTHRNVVRLVKNTNYVPLNRETRVLQTGAPVFDATTFEIWGSLLNGGQLVLVNEEIILDAHRLEYALKAHHINTLWLSAPLFNRLVQENPRMFAPLQYLLVGGDTLTPGHINTVKEAYPALKIINGYGPTENTTFSTTYLIEEKFEQNIPIGRPINNSRAYIVDKNNNFLPMGVWGELLVGGDGVSLGYLNNPELTNSKFQAPAGHPLRIPNSLLSFSASQLLSFSLYRTGDLARWLPGGVIEFKGRMDRQVKIRGFRIELEEIEKRLCDHQQVKEAVVIDRSDRGEKYLCAYVVPLSNAAPAAPELKNHLSRCLPTYMVPSYFITLAQIPLTPNGKINRKSLPPPTGEIDTGVTYTPARSKEEMLICDIWQEVLQLDRVGIHDNFFDLGGNSLKVIAVNRKLKETFNRDIPVVILFRYPSISALAEYLSREQGAEEEKPKLRVKERARGKNRQKTLKARRRQ